MIMKVILNQYYNLKIEESGTRTIEHGEEWINAQKTKLKKRVSRFLIENTIGDTGELFFFALSSRIPLVSLYFDHKIADETSTYLISHLPI